MAGSECACAAFCVAVWGVVAGDEGAIINAGPILSLANMGCFLLWQPVGMLVNPVAGEPPTGEPDAGDPLVRFGGRGSRNQLALPTPIIHPGRYAAYYSRFERFKQKTNAQISGPRLDT